MNFGFPDDSGKQQRSGTRPTYKAHKIVWQLPQVIAGFAGGA